MAVIGFGQGLLNVQENPREIFERIEGRETARLAVSDQGGVAIALRGWINATTTDGTALAIQVSSIAYVAPTRHRPGVPPNLR